MFRIGLSSSAFLASNPEEVVSRAKTLGFEGVEWAGSPHLDAGDPESAKGVMLATLRSGLTVVSYAPLYRIVPGGGRGISFEAILNTAREIYAPVIRLYTGEAPKKGTEDRSAIISELRRLGDAAGEHGITVSISHNPRSTLPTLKDAILAVESVDHPFIRLSWESGPSSLREFDLGALESAPELFAILRPRAVDQEGRSVGLSSEAAYWTRVITAFSSKPGPRDIGRFMLLGEIGDCNDETLAGDLAFARKAASIPEAIERG